MPDDDRPYIRVDVGMPDHPKVAGLSAGAFRALVTAWCYCARQRTDGFIPNEVFRKFSSKRHANALRMAHLLEHVSGGVIMHDYLRHQSSAATIAERNKTRRMVSEQANHQRWHAKTGRYSPDCTLCTASQTDPETDPETDPKRDPLQESQEVEVEVEEELKEPPGGASFSARAAARRPAPPKTTAVELAETAHPPDAHRLVERFANTCHRRPPYAIRRRLAADVGELLALGWTEPDIDRSLNEWNRKGLDAKVFLSVAHETVNRQPKQSTGDQRVSQALSLLPKYAAQDGYTPDQYQALLRGEHVDPPDPPSLRQIEKGDAS